MNSSNCSICNAALLVDDIFCKECGYPENGTLEQRDAHDRVIITKNRRLAEAVKKVANVKMMLYIIAGLNLLVGLFMLFGLDSYLDAIVLLISALVFVGCAQWVENQPLAGILSAFVYWIFLQLSVVFIDPAQIFSGLFLKILILVTFIKGISSAKEAKEIRHELGAAVIK